MALADDIYKNAQAGQQQSGQTVGNALEAYGAVERLQNAKSQLEMQKSNNETAKATAFLGQLDSLSRMSPSMQNVALKGMENTWRQMYSNMSPDFSAAMKEDKDFRAQTLQVASDALQQLRNGQPLTPEMAQKLNSVPGLQATELYGYIQKAQEDFSRRQQAALLAQNKIDVQEIKGEQKAAAGPKPTKGQEAVDRAFGKTYEEFQASGGKAEYEKNLAKLEDALTQLESGKVKTGGAGAYTGEAGMEILNPKLAELKEQIQSAVQGMFRPTLGAQFTEKEGERLMKTEFNPRLSGPANVKKLRAAIGARRAQAEAKLKAIQYYEEHGTLTGFKGGVGMKSAPSALTPEAGPAPGPAAANTALPAIQKALSQGHAPAEIVQKLTAKGYSPEQAQAMIDEAGGQ